MSQESNSSADAFSRLIHTRRSVRRFLPNPVPQAMLDALLADANQSPSWSNTQPYRIAIATDAVRDQLATQLTQRFDAGMRAQRQGWLGKLRLLATQRNALPDGDFKTSFDYPQDLQPARRSTGHGLYELLGIGRQDHAAREAQMRKNFEFFDAPVAIFVFVHSGLHEFSALDAGIFMQTLMLGAHARGLGTCAQGALATWAGPVREAFDVPPAYKMICGISLGYPAPDAVNQYNPGRGDVAALKLVPRH